MMQVAATRAEIVWTWGIADPTMKAVVHPVNDFISDL
jgi:hypothetical protein